MAFILNEKIGAVGKLTLNRPDKFNSFCRDMALELQEQLDLLANDDNIRAIYLTGTGKAFCAGQDLAEAIEDNGIELADIVTRHYNPIIMRLRSIEKPIVCAVNGVAAGAGANIALAADITVAAESASFIQAFSKIGLIPDSGGTYTLPRLIGMQKACAYMMLGEKVSAQEAERVGMIYAYYSDDTFAQQSMNLAETLSKMPTVGLGLTKRLLNESYNNSLAQQLTQEGIVQVIAANSQDYTEGVTAFLEKRTAVFTGK